MNRDSFDIANAFVNQVLTVLATGQAHWRKACMMSRRWRVSDDESRRVLSEGEGACSLLFKVRSHLPLRGKLGWMTPRVGVKTTLTNGNAPLGALVPKQGPHFFAIPGTVGPRFCLPDASGLSGSIPKQSASV